MSWPSWISRLAYKGERHAAGVAQLTQPIGVAFKQPFSLFETGEAFDRPPLPKAYDPVEADNRGAQPVAFWIIEPLQYSFDIAHELLSSVYPPLAQPQAHQSSDGMGVLQG
jgi:hypothetical protein